LFYEYLLWIEDHFLDLMFEENNLENFFEIYVLFRVGNLTVSVLITFITFDMKFVIFVATGFSGFLWISALNSGSFLDLMFKENTLEISWEIYVLFRARGLTVSVIITLRQGLFVPEKKHVSKLSL